MKKKVLTIVVPAYNVEKYLREALIPYVFPICDQRLEVIVVNDGSMDDTEKIALSYAKKYPNVIKVISKQNAGHGSAINTGLIHSTGMYFKVIDGDDFVNNAQLIHFLDLLQKSQDDVISNNKIQFIDGTNQKYQVDFSSISHSQHLSFEQMDTSWHYDIHCITVKTDILRKYMPAIDEKCFYVDQEFIFYCLPFVKTLTISDMVLYYYRLGNVNQSVSIPNMYKRRSDLLKVIYSLLRFYPSFMQNAVFSKVIHYFNYSMARLIQQYARIILTNPNMTQEDLYTLSDLYDVIRTQYPKIYEQNPFHKGWFLLKIVKLSLYKQIVKSYLRLRKRI